MSRPPHPPFSAETAAQKARLAEDARNTRDPARVALAYTDRARRHPIRSWARLPRCVPRAHENLRQAHRPLLGLPRRPPGSARGARRPKACRTHPPVCSSVMARSSATVTDKLTKASLG